MSRQTYLDQEPIVAIATPSGEGAIGIIRISGERAVATASGSLLFRGGRKLEDLQSQRSTLATFHQKGRGLDHVLVTLFKNPHSFTGEDVIEISCHGGTAILKKILGCLIQSGARPAQPGEFSQRAFLNGKMDLIQAEAVCDLIRAQTNISSEVAYSQLEGALSKEIHSIRDRLIEILAHIEVKIDHSDDKAIDQDHSLEMIQKILEDQVTKISHLINSYSYGKLAKEGVKVSIIGRPNVGKSTLLNQILKSDRAIVTPTPGTTRDTIEEGFDLMGLPAILVDTAGLRGQTLDPIEKIGMQKTEKALQESDALIVMVDGSQELSQEDLDVFDRVGNHKKGIIAINKWDQSHKMEESGVQSYLPDYPVVAISALKNQGIDRLLTHLHHKVISGNGTVHSLKNDLLVCSLRHYDLLVKGREGLERALGQISGSSLEECIAFEIQQSLDALGEMTGEVMSDDILKEVFSKFCIGK